MFRKFTLVFVLALVTLLVVSACTSGPTAPTTPAPGPSPGTPPITAPGIVSFSCSFPLPGTTTQGIISGSVVITTRVMTWTVKGPSGYEVWIEESSTSTGRGSGSAYNLSRPGDVVSTIPLGVTEMFFPIWTPPTGVQEWFPTRSPDYVCKISGW